MMRARNATADLPAQELKQVFGLALRRLRVARGLSQRQMAAQNGLSQYLLSAVENGRANTSLTMMVRLAAAVGSDVPLMLMKGD